ncbi:hypothetical protein AUP68_10506 [Ilyonectria robusta]
MPVTDAQRDVLLLHETPPAAQYQNLTCGVGDQLTLSTATNSFPSPQNRGPQQSGTWDSQSARRRPHVQPVCPSGLGSTAELNLTTMTLHARFRLLVLADYSILGSTKSAND